MTFVSDQMQTRTPVDIGPVLQVDLTAAQINLATTVPANSFITSQLVFTNGYKEFSFGITSNEAGQVSIQRYIDTAGNIAQGDPLIGNLIVGNSLVINCTDNLPFESLIITVTNSSGSIATLSNVMLLLQAN